MLVDSIALVNVPYGTGGESMRPLGLSYLGAYLTSHNISVEAFDFSDSTLPPETLVCKYSLSAFPIIGLSFYNINASLAYRMARCIKQINPKCHVIAGGPHASAAHNTIFTIHPEIDVVVRNEGEITLLELIQAISYEKPLSEVDGISYQHEGKCLSTTERGRINDLDQLPAPILRYRGSNTNQPQLFADRSAQKLKHSTALVTSRSCPYNCSFCAIILIGRQWRSCSPEKVVDDLIAIEKFEGVSYEHVYFFDANFFVDVKRTLSVAEALQRYRKGITFSFSTRVNQLVKAKDSLPILYDLGLRSVELGIESASPAALMRYSKDTKPEQNVEALCLLRQYRIQLGLDFIMFDAESTLEDLQLNLEFFEKNGLDSYIPWDHIFSYMTPYLGTKIRDRYESLLGQTFDEDTLPEPSSLIANNQVRAIFTELWKMREHIPSLTSALQETESRIDNAWNSDIARLKLNAVTFRRLPFIILRKLLEQAKAQQEIRLDHAMPRFFNDNNQPVNLEDILNYALQ
jgi:radical SAM superfamily enzyme YgiQ (UPF0313 family)